MVTGSSEFRPPGASTGASGEAIPKDWECRQLRELVRKGAPVCYGIVQPGPDVEGGVPVVAIRDLTTDYVNTHRSSPSIEARYVRSRVVPGDILLSVKGTTGRVGQVPKHFHGNVSRDIARIRFNDNHVPGFWFQMLQSESAQRSLGVAVVGTTRQELSIGVLKDIALAFPSKEEQGIIARVLADGDSLIRALDKLIAKKRAIKRSAMQQLLTARTRLPDFTGPWRTSSLGNVAQLSKGVQLNRSTLLADGYPVWNGGVTPSGFTDDWNTPENTITISEGGNSCGFVGFVGEKFWRGGHCYAVEKLGAGFDLSFLYQALKVRENAIMALRVGSGLPNIQKRRLLDFTFEHPDLVEQRAVAAILFDMDAEIATLERRGRKARAIKQGLMQALLTGRVRLKQGRAGV
jgi:type I restriction enzyme, S subunit